jgi:hypothetical protein
MEVPLYDGSNAAAPRQRGGSEPHRGHTAALMNRLCR